MKTHLALAALAAFIPTTLPASTVTPADPQAGGIGYKCTVTMGGLDSAIFSSHVGAWSWEDNSLFGGAGQGTDSVGWTHTSDWVAHNVTVTSVFTIRVGRDAAVPWPSMADPNRLASTASMFPAFTIFRNWDNDVVPDAFKAKQETIDAFAPDPVPADLADWHTYNNRGAIEWAEDLVYRAHTDNSTLETVEVAYVLEPGQYSIVIGSNAPATDANRQGYKATFTTTQDLPVDLRGDSYFTGDSVRPLVVPVAKGILVNDSGIDATTDDIELTAQPAHGTVVVNSDGSFTYTPGAYFVVAGLDSFAYRLLIDGDPGTPTEEAHVTISTFAAAAGAHAGTIEDEDTSAVVGLVKLDVTRLGRWTGIINFDGEKSPAAGTVGLKGELLLQRTEARTRRRHLDHLDLEMRLAAHADGERHAHIHIDSGGEHFGAEVRKSPYTAEAPAPFAGRHNLTFAVDTASTGAPTAVPRGRLLVRPNGSAVFSGFLGDRTPFSCATALLTGSGPGPVVPIFASVYVARGGSIAGELEFFGAAASDATGSIDVVKPARATPAAPGYTATYDITTSRP